jgi:hypothetical protein
MTAITTDLDRLMDEHDARQREADRRRAISRGVLRAHRRRVEAASDAHPLAKARVRFRDGLTVAELSERSTVAPRVIAAIEAREERGSDRTWQRLCLALGGCPRASIDPIYVYAP